MRRIMRFVWRTFLGGVLFLAPLLLTLVLIREGIRLVGRVLNPIATHLPLKPAFGLDAPEIAALVLLVLIGFLAGLAAQTAIAERISRTFEQLILKKMPGYTLFKSVAEGAAGEGSRSELKVALANIDDAWLISFIVEEHADGLLTVFIPSAPTPTAGSLYFLTEEQVKRLDVPVSAAISCIMQLGVGSRKLIEGKTALIAAATSGS